ncbi:MAG: RNA-guided endonuclease InsQ/TnpB family protein [Candidatus Hodarchaeales archaeon]|jgi:IS605 OrfB family transposase
MLRTIQCPLPLDNDLVDTIQVYNQVVQFVVDMGWHHRTFNKYKLHQLTYHPIRERFPSLQSSLVQCARDMASEMLKRDQFRRRKPCKKPLSAIRYNQRTFTPFLQTQELSISTTRGRKRFPLLIPPYFQQYPLHSTKSLTLRVKRQQMIAYLTIELPDIPVVTPKTFLGVDRGIQRIAVCSNNQFYPTTHILAVKWKYQQMRRQLQSKGTRSAKRKLREVAGRERRFMTDMNRQVAKWLVSQPYDCLILENLRGLKQHSKQKKKIAKKIRRKYGNWAYYQLERFIIEQAEKVGKLVLFVSPKYTSQRCWQCGYISKQNRTSQAEFSCTECGYKLNANLNASRNLSDFGKAVIGRASVNSPNVAVVPMTETILSLERQLQASEVIQK